MSAPNKNSVMTAAAALVVDGLYRKKTPTGKKVAESLAVSFVSSMFLTPLKMQIPIIADSLAFLPVDQQKMVWDVMCSTMLEQFVVPALGGSAAPPLTESLVKWGAAEAVNKWRSSDASKVIIS